MILPHIYIGQTAEELTVLIGEHEWKTKNTMNIAIKEDHPNFCDSGCG